MGDIQGLFNLSNFDEAGENDLLDMSLNESAMTESADPQAAKKSDDALRREMNELTGLIGDLRKLAEDEKMDENLKKILKAKIEFLDTKRMNILKACQNSMKESVEVTESTEIQDKCPSCNPEVEFDPSTKTNQEIPVPGGDKEQPSTSMKELEIPVPGGDKEQPSSKPSGQSIPAAGKVLLDSDTYNSALEQLQKSFKEAVDVINLIQKADVVSLSLESKQEAYAEAAMDEAYYNALIDGPMFEYVSRDDKDEVKAITKKISKEVKSFCAEHDYDFYQPKYFSRMVVSSVDSNIPAVRVKTFRKLFSNKMWQVIGVLYMDDSDEKKVQKMLNDKYKEDLGEYKIILQSCGYGGIIEWFNAIFKKRNRDRLPYVLYVDRTFDKELEKAIKDAAKDKEN